MPHSAKRYRNKRQAAPRIDNRPNSSQRNYGSEWSRGTARREAIERDKGLCQDCWDEGNLVSIFRNGRCIGIFDHIIPLHIRPDLKLVVDNLRCLCRKHHAIKTRKDMQDYEGA